MAKRSRHNRGGKRPYRSGSSPPPPVQIPVSKPPVEYGPTITLLEDESKATFEFKSGTWVPYAMSIAECRLQQCQVNELPQKVKFMTRYEVRCPLD